MNEEDRLIQAKLREIKGARAELEDVSPVASSKTPGVDATLEPYDRAQFVKKRQKVADLERELRDMGGSYGAEKEKTNA